MALSNIKSWKERLLISRIKYSITFSGRVFHENEKKMENITLNNYFFSSSQILLIFFQLFFNFLSHASQKNPENEPATNFLQNIIKEPQNHFFIYYNVFNH